MPEAAVLKDVAANPCCAPWKDKLSKLQQKCAKMEEGRTALRRGIELYARQIEQMQTEITCLKKACEEERAHTENERKEKVKESAERVSLENEISALKSEILSLHQKEGSKADYANEELMLVVDCDETEMKSLREQLKEAKMEVDSERKKTQEDKKIAEDALKTVKAEKLRVDEDLTLLRSLISDRETEINLLREHLQVERTRAALEEKKKAEAEKKEDEACEYAKAEKMRADEELTLLQSRVCENQTEINLLREQLKEVRIRAASEEKKAEAEKKQADEACENATVEKLRADEDLTLLRSLVCEKDTEINLLREQLQEVRIRATFEEKKKGDEACENANPEECEVKGFQDDEEREVKMKESLRLCLEEEISSLKSQILLLQQKGDSIAENVDEEVTLLRMRVSEGETEINRLKELLDKERIRADSEKKKTEAEKKNGNEAWEIVKQEKCRVDKERRIADNERKKATEYRLQFEKLKIEADEARSKLVIQTLKCEEASKKLEADRQHTIKEKIRADLEKAKAEKLKKLAEVNESKALEEKCRADHLCQQLEEDRQRFEKLKKELEEEPLSSRQMVEIPVYEAVKPMNIAKLGNGPQVFNQNAEEWNLEESERRLVEAKQKAADQGKRGCTLEMRKVVEHRIVAEAYREKASEEKARADQLTHLLEENRRLTENFWKEMELASPKKLLEPSVVCAEASMGAEVNLLRKELKLEKSRLKHAKQVVKLEKQNKNILEQELYRIKTEFTQFSHRLELCNCFTKCDVGIGRPAKNRCGNSKRKRESSETHCMHLRSINELVKSSCAYTDASDCLKQSIECRAPMLGNQTEFTSGIASKLPPLLRGSNRKNLHSSAIDSSMASFSDNPLVGSQEICDLSISKSAEWDEEKLKPLFPNPRLSAEVNRTQNNMVAKNSDRNPLNAVRRAEHSKKRKRILNAIDVVEQLFPEVKKWHPEIIENACMLPHVLESQMDKPSHELGVLHRDLHQRKIYAVLVEEGAMMSLRDTNSQKDDLRTEAIDGTDLHASSPLDNVTGVAQTGKDSGKRYLECFEKVVDGNYMRLLDLDDTSDEESYLLAIERPLSPSLPEVEFRSGGAIGTDDPNCSFIGCFLEKLSHLKDYTASYSGFDATSEKLDSNLSKLGAYGKLDSLKISTSDEKSNLDTTHARSARFSQIQDYVVKEGISRLGDQGFKTLRDSNFRSIHDNPPTYCVVFSDIKESNSLAKIYSTTRTLKNQCLVFSQANRVAQNLMAALLEYDDLLPKEKVSVFFSMLLDNCFWNFKRHFDMDLAHFFDFSIGHMMKVISDLETRSILVKSCILDELITLIEDFLIDRRILVQVDGTQPSVLSDSRVTILNCGDVKLSFQTVSPELLMCGAFALAALCAEFGRIGFLCEASYNVARVKKLDSLVLTILHVFAYICGCKYFALKDYSLIMTVLKSLVTFIENESGSTCSASFHRCMGLGWPESPVCTQCPFHEGAVPINELTALLLEKLQSYSCLHEFGGLECQSHTNGDGTLCKLADLLSLLELAAANMSWEWTCDNINPQLLTVLESPILKNGSAASLILLGQLLRIGIDAKGAEDRSVKNIRGRLCVFLSQSTKKVDMPVQIATVGALLGTMSLSFEEVVESNTDLPEVSSLLGPADCIRNWYSLL